MALIEQKGTAVSGAVSVGSFTGEDLWSEIGASKDQLAFARRTQALSKPGDYEAARSKALEELKKSSVETFKSTYSMYTGAGFGISEAKNLSTAAAKVNYEIGMKALRASFPSAADNMFQSANTSQGVLLARGATRARRSAPKKTKKKAAKRR